MPGGIQLQCPEVCCGDLGHNWVGHTRLEATGAVPSTAHTQMALYTGADADDDAAERRAATPFPCNTHEGHLCPGPCLMGMDDRSAPILARPCLCTPLQWVSLEGQRARQGTD